MSNKVCTCKVVSSGGKHHVTGLEWDPNCPAHPKGLDGRKDTQGTDKGRIGSFLDRWRDGDTGSGDLTAGAKGTGTTTGHTSWTSGGVKPPSVYVPKSCVHDGSKPAFTITRPEAKRGQSPTVQIYGARGSSLMKDGADLTHLDLLIDMSGIVKSPRKFAKAGSWGARALNVAAFPEVLSLDWPDMTAPTHVPAHFWVKLLAMLPPAVCISCVGSHGRTGTAMACLLVASGMSADKAIATVRQDHCSHAIETQGQQAYIHKIAKALGH